MRRILYILLFIGLLGAALAAYQFVPSVRETIDAVPFIGSEIPILNDCQLEPTVVTNACVIEIGVLSRFTTDGNTCFAGGQEHRRGYEMARSELGDIGGCQIVLVPYDDWGNAERALRKADEFATDEVAMMVGSYTSSATLSTASVADFRQIPLLVLSSTSELITSLEYRWVFRINATSSDLVEQVFEYLETWDDLPTIGVLYENTVFGESNALSLASEAEDRGFVVAIEEHYPPGVPSEDAEDARRLMIDIWQGVRQANPDILFLASNRVNDAASLLAGIQSQVNSPKLVIGMAGSYASPALFAEAGDAADGLVLTAQWDDDVNWTSEDGMTAVDFAERYAKEYPDEPLAARTLQAYAAITLAHEAIEIAVNDLGCDPEGGSSLRVCIRRVLRDLEKEDSLFGEINFDDETGQNEHEVLLLQVKESSDGGYEFVTVYPTKFRTEEIQLNE